MITHVAAAFTHIKCVHPWYVRSNDSCADGPAIAADFGNNDVTKSPETPRVDGRYSYHATDVNCAAGCRRRSAW